jgi:hypothetical protein
MYSNYLQSFTTPTNLNLTSSPNLTTTALNQTFILPSSLTTSTATANTEPDVNEARAEPASEQAQPQQQQQQEQAAQPEPQQPRAQQRNRQANNNDGADREDDWLGMLHNFVSFIVLFSIIYYYSSLERFLVIFTIVLILIM